MSEVETISATQHPNTVSTICRDLQKLGVNEGDSLLVHSSLSSLGWVCGGPQSVILALLKAVGKDGTLAMPAHSGDWSDPDKWENPPVPKDWLQTIYDEMPAYDPGVTPTRGIGRVPELFRTFPGTKRSGHPQVSFSANGLHAAHIVEDHPLTPQFGMASPLGKLYNLSAKVLLLGAGYGSCTSFHLAEVLTGKMPVIQMGTAILENGERIWKWFDDIDCDTDDFELIGKALDQSGSVRIGKVGNAECRLFEMKAGVDFVREWLEKNRFIK